MRAAGALVLPGHDPKRYAKHVTATLFPSRGEGLAEAAEEFNRRLRPARLSSRRAASSSPGPEEARGVERGRDRRQRERRA